MSKLALIPVHDRLANPQPAALYAAAAAKYVKIDVADFRELVKDGVIPARSHTGRVRDIYLIDDLDEYLKSLPVKNRTEGAILSFGRGLQTSKKGD